MAKQGVFFKYYVMAKVKLQYFNLMGRAEAIRWILAYGGVDYEDVRHDREKWGPDNKKGT